jgi:hypothetical protein
MGSKRGRALSYFLGHVYNYDIFERRPAENEHFRSLSHAGANAPAFTLHRLDSKGELTLSELRGRPVMIEFGPIT